MANYKCPIQEHIDALQKTANQFKVEKIRQLYNKGWSIYYYKPNCSFSVVAVSNTVTKEFSKLNFTNNILQAIEDELEEDDFVVF